jgi:hypothetical protein
VDADRDADHHSYAWADQDPHAHTDPLHYADFPTDTDFPTDGYADAAGDPFSLAVYLRGEFGTASVRL